MTTEIAPLILTLTMNDATQAHFTTLRNKHFPPERNYLNAHITLFHALPGEHYAALAGQLAQLAGLTHVFRMATSEVMFLGGGSAYTLDAPPAIALRRTLADAFATWLTPQDARQNFKPHITIQNKVDAGAAKELFAALTAAFQPMHITATGLDLWHYRGGPWEHAQFFPFLV